MKWFRRKKPNRRSTPSESRRVNWSRFAGIAVITLAVVGVVAGVSIYLRDIEWERFRALEITGELDRVSAGEVRDVLRPHIADGFARIDMRAARLSLEALPWVADAAVRREWPGTLVVALREERPVATWFGTALMNKDGEVFVDGAAGYSGVLPDIGGPAGTQHEMIRRMEEIHAAVSNSDLQLRRLLRTDRRAERFWLETGNDDVAGKGISIEVRLGRRDADMRMQRFLDVAWPSLKTRAAEVAYVDMRYTNGFAVGWKSAGNGSVARRERS